MSLTLRKNDRRANVLIWVFSVVVFVLVTVLERVTLDVNIGFDPHLLALINAVINSVVSVLLLAGLFTAKAGKYRAHKNIMLVAIGLSVIFLLTYVLHHLFAGSTWYGDVNRNGVLEDTERAAAGSSLHIYRTLLGTHILLAGVSLPFILFTAYRALINENARHRKIARYTWPMWFYVAATGPIVYWMISRYY